MVSDPGASPASIARVVELQYIVSALDSVDKARHKPYSYYRTMLLGGTVNTQPLLNAFPCDDGCLSFARWP